MNAEIKPQTIDAVTLSKARRSQQKKIFVSTPLRLRLLTLFVVVGLAACAGDKPARHAPAPDHTPPASANPQQLDLFAFKLFSQAQMAMGQGDAKKAVELYRRSLSVYESLEDHTAQAAIHNDLGLILRSAGQTKKARGILERAVELARRGDNPLIISEALLNLGLVCYDMGENDAALMKFSDALDEADRANDSELRGLASNARGNAHRRADAFGAAIDDYLVAAKVWAELGRDNFTAMSNMNIGYCQVLAGELDKAAVTFQNAADLFGDEDSADKAALLPHIESLIRLLKTDADGARTKILKALGRAEETSD